MGDAVEPGLEGHAGHEPNRDEPGRFGTQAAGSTAPAGGAWDSFDLLPCTDGKARRVESFALWMVNGLSSGVDDLWDSCVLEISKKIKIHAEKCKANGGEILRTMREYYRESAIQWAAGGQECFSKEAILFAALCELERMLGRLINGAASGISEKQKAVLRDLRANETPQERAARPSPGRGYEEQLPGELANIVRELPQDTSHLLAHGFPLARGVEGRANLLRGYGNAIVPQVAAEFILASLDAIGGV